MSALANLKDLTADFALINKWLAHIGETDKACIDEVLDACRENPEAMAYFVHRSREVNNGDTMSHLRI